MGQIGQDMSESNDTPIDDLINEVVADNVIEVNGRQHHSWELPANSAPSALGEKIQMLCMSNPQQILRVFRADETIFITAIEGEEWSKV